MRGKTRIAKALLFAGIIGVLPSPPLRAQSTIPTKDSRPCGAIDNVAVESSNPFTAERLTKSIMTSPDGTKKPMEIVEKLARDSAGRIRFEKHARLSDDAEEITLNTRDGDKMTVTKERLTTYVTIFDCPSGKTISLQVGLQTAQVKDGPAGSLPWPGDHLYSHFFTTLLHRENLHDVSAEDVGYREIEGILAHGVRVTNLGTEKDGEWKGKPINIHESWASDDLATTLLDIDTDLKAGSERRITLTKIKRVEPDSSFFEVPPGYKVNPTPDQMPFQVLK